ncbi:MAG: TraV family lipoprotein [Mariprofundales bacterium]
MNFDCKYMMEQALKVIGKCMLLLLAGVGLLIGGCASYGCNAPDGVSCKPVSEVYDKQQEAQQPKDKHKARLARSNYYSQLPKSPQAGDPMRSRERVIRIWMSPWIDAEKDFHDQSWMYVVLDQGHWYIEEQYQQITNNYIASGNQNQQIISIVSEPEITPDITPATIVTPTVADIYTTVAPVDSTEIESDVSPYSVPSLFAGDSQP